MFILERSKPSTGLIDRLEFETLNKLQAELENIKEHYQNCYGDHVVAECPEDSYIEILLDHWIEPLVYTWRTE